MKKYILLLFSISCFGQFNPVQWYEFSKGNYEPNTFIGGVGGTINTREMLAARLGINTGRIKNFQITGSDIACTIINGSYTLRSLGADVRGNLTYFIDKEGNVNQIGSNAFTFGISLKYVYLPGVIVQDVGDSICQDVFTGFVLDLPNCIYVKPNLLGNWNAIGKTLVLPRCENFGPNELDNFVFSGVNKSNLKLYAPISKQTSNSGIVEGDVNSVLTSSGSQVVFVANYISPEQITDLSAGTITSTSIQVNFTAPTGSTNAIDFYEVWLNGFPYQEISGSGQTITGLTAGTSYEIEIKPVDIYYNKSTSNKINVSTL